MSYRHLSIYERGRIEELYDSGYSVRKIAAKLQRSASTISREIRRNSRRDNYHGDTAQTLYENRRKSCTWHGTLTEDLAKLIVDKIKLIWSPEQISHTATFGKVCTTTIYNWLYAGKLPGVIVKQLRHKGKRRNKESRGTFSMGRSIRSRPKEVDSKDSFGQWELDTILSGRGASKGCLTTFVERKSRLYTAIKMKDRTASSMEQAIKQLYTILPKGAFLTATTDRGREFAWYDRISKDLGLPMFFADPYAHWQRGSNENSNGLLREFYPKKIDLAKIKQQN